MVYIIDSAYDRDMIGFLKKGMRFRDSEFRNIKEQEIAEYGYATCINKLCEYVSLYGASQKEHKGKYELGPLANKKYH